MSDGRPVTRPTKQDAQDSLKALTAMAVEMARQGLLGSAATMSEHLDVLDDFVRETAE